MMAGNDLLKSTIRLLEINDIFGYIEAAGETHYNFRDGIGWQITHSSLIHFFAWRPAEYLLLLGPSCHQDADDH